MTTTDTPRTIHPVDLQPGDFAAVKIDEWQLAVITDDNYAFWGAHAKEAVLLHRPEPVWPDAPLILIKAGDVKTFTPRPLPVLAVRDSSGDYMDANGKWWLKVDAIITDWEPMTAVPTRLVNQLRDAVERPLCSAGLVRDAASNLLKEVTSD